MNEEERHVLVEAVKWVDEVITGEGEGQEGRRGHHG